MSALSTWGRAALTYAQRIGWAVHPLRPNAKTPLSAHGFKDATTDLDQIRTWWTEHPSANIGIATGKVSGISVLDVDTKDGAGGDITLAALLAEHGQTLDGHARQTTWSGGWQYIFTYHPRARHGAGCYGRGLDGRNDGGFIVAPPSLVHGQPYVWSGPGVPQPMPEWLLEATRGTAGARHGLKTSSLPAPQTDPSALAGLRQWLSAAKLGTSGVVRCPAHADRSPSLQVWKVMDGSARYRCWAGCEAEIVAFMVTAPPDAETWSLASAGGGRAA